MWDLNKSGPTKYGKCLQLNSTLRYQAEADFNICILERRIRQHVRSIHKIAYSAVLRDYCITGSADGDIRVWVR